MTFAYGESEVDKIDEFTIVELTSSVQITVVRAKHRQLHIPTFRKMCHGILKLIQACSVTIRRWLPLINLQIAFFCEHCREKGCPVKNHFIPIPPSSTATSDLRCQADQICRPTKKQQYWLEIPKTPENLMLKGDLSATELQGVAEDVQTEGKLRDLADALEVVPLLKSLDKDTNASLTLLQRWQSGMESSLETHTLLVYHLECIGLVKTSAKLLYREFLSHADPINVANRNTPHSGNDDQTKPLSLMDITACSRYIDGDLTLLAAALDIPDEEMSTIRSKYKNVHAQALQMLKKWQLSGTRTREELIKLLQSYCTGFSQPAHILESMLHADPMTAEKPSTQPHSGNHDQTKSLSHMHIAQVERHRYQDTGERPTLPELLKFPVKGGKYINIPQQIGTKYFQFGIQLLNDETGKEIEAIESKYREQAEEINLKILRLWIAGRGKPLGWDSLIEVLKAIGLGTLASDIQDGL